MPPKVKHLLKPIYQLLISIIKTIILKNMVQPLNLLYMVKVI